MSCEEARDSLSALALGALSAAEAAEVERHLDACPACRAELACVRRALALAAGEPFDGSDRLTARIVAAGRAELAASMRTGRRRRAWVLAAGAAAAAAIVAAASLGLFGPRPDNECGGCWRFVEGDAGNCRRAETAAAPVPQSKLWEQPLPDKAYAYKPLAWKELVIVGTQASGRAPAAGGRLLALDGASGRVRWQREFAAGDFYKAKGFPDRCILNGRLYVTDGSRCLVLDAATGRDLAALAPPAGARGWSYLAAEGARLYGASRDGRAVFCLEAAGGGEVWTRPAPGAVFVPALADGRLYLHTGTGTLSALDAASGRELWCSAPGGRVPAGRASLHVRGKTGLLLAENGGVLAFSPADGLALWQRHVPGAFASGLALGDDAVYLQGGGLALALADGRPLWEPADANAVCGAPIAAGGEVLVAVGSGARALSLRDGAGRLVGAVATAAARPCEGVIAARGRVYAIGDGSLMAVGLRPRG